MVTLPSWLVSTDFGTWSYYCLLSNFTSISFHMLKFSWAHILIMSLCTVLLPVLGMLIWCVPLPHQIVYRVCICCLYYYYYYSSDTLMLMWNLTPKFILVVNPLHVLTCDIIHYLLFPSWPQQIRGGESLYGHNVLMIRDSGRFWTIKSHMVKNPSRIALRVNLQQIVT
jgi:hypothetical protein